METREREDQEVRGILPKFKMTWSVSFGRFLLLMFFNAAGMIMAAYYVGLWGEFTLSVVFVFGGAPGLWRVSSDVHSANQAQLPPSSQHTNAATLTFIQLASLFRDIELQQQGQLLLSGGLGKPPQQTTLTERHKRSKWWRAFIFLTKLQWMFIRSFCNGDLDTEGKQSRKDKMFRALQPHSQKLFSVCTLLVHANSWR